MTNAVLRRLDLPARILMSLLFFVSCFEKLTQTASMQSYMHGFGVPPVLIWPAAAMELASGVLLVLGLFLQPLGLVLAVWCLLTAAIFHTHWSDPVQQLMFLKNMTMAGGFLVMAIHAPSGLFPRGRTVAARIA